MIIKTAIKCSIVCFTLLLSGCDSLINDSLSNICEDSPELCNDLPTLGDCRYKRTTLIRARYYDKIETSEINKRQLLAELDGYHGCLEATLHLEYTRNKHRKEQRLKNYLRTETLMQEALHDVKGTQDPMLAFYLWTRHQDTQAREVFLAAANKEDVTDPRLLFKLAIVKAKYEPQYALALFYRALVLTDSLDQIPASNLVFIMNIFYQHKKFENAYIWALIAKRMDSEDDFPINLEMILKRGINTAEKSIHNEVQLQIQADKYYLQLQAGNFNQQAPALR